MDEIDLVSLLSSSVPNNSDNCLSNAALKDIYRRNFAQSLRTNLLTSFYGKQNTAMVIYLQRMKIKPRYSDAS